MKEGFDGGVTVEFHRAKAASDGGFHTFCDLINHQHLRGLRGVFIQTNFSVSQFTLIYAF
jgi:hypothetical protein